MDGKIFTQKGCCCCCSCLCWWQCMQMKWEKEWGSWGLGGGVKSELLWGATTGVECWGEEGALWQQAQRYKFCCNRSRCPRRRAERQMIKHKLQPECLSFSVWWQPATVVSNKLKFGMERKSAFFVRSHSRATASRRSLDGAETNSSRGFFILLSLSLCVCRPLWWTLHRWNQS